VARQVKGPAEGAPGPELRGHSAKVFKGDEVQKVKPW